MLHWLSKSRAKEGRRGMIEYDSYCPDLSIEEPVVPGECPSCMGRVPDSSDMLECISCCDWFCRECMHKATLCTECAEDLAMTDTEASVESRNTIIINRMIRDLARRDSTGCL